MLKEIGHFLIHSPGTLALKRKCPPAELYDLLMKRGDESGFAAWRKALVADLSGRVLEVGSGTGLMFQHYRADVHLFALEKDPEFMDLAKSSRPTTSPSMDLLVGDGTELPFSARIFDYVVISLVLCSVSSVARVLSEVRRVLKPEGEVRLIEHVRSAKALSGRLMDVFNPLWLTLNHQGCHMNRRTETLLEQHGFDLREVQPFKVFVPGLPAFPMRWIRSVPL